ncbi:MAG: c-type cytochrome [Verrucomicrobiota bacterium]
MKFPNFLRITIIARGAAACLIALAYVGMAEADVDARGKELYRNCTICHGTDGQGIALQYAPALAGLSEKYIVEQLKKFKSGVRGAHPDDRAGLRMLPLAQTMRTEEDMQAVASYIATLKPAPQEKTILGGNPETGKMKYMVCQACHGVDGKGNDALNSPGLINQHDWYLAQQLHNFKDKVRGADPRDTSGMTMAPMSATLLNDQDIADVIAYIETLAQ